MERLRECRKRMNLTMKELGAIVGVTEAAISHYELGKRQPDYDLAVKLSDCLGVTVDYLLGREEATVPPQEKAPAKTKDDFILERAREMNKEELQALLAKIIEIGMEK